VLPASFEETPQNIARIARAAVKARICRGYVRAILASDYRPQEQSIDL
jgi:hypothetical protein